MVVSWGGLCRRGPTLDTRLLFCCLKDSEQVHEQHATLYRALHVLRWSFSCMALGLPPERDHGGKAFTNPRRLALAGKPLIHGSGGNLLGAWRELRGDWQFLRGALNLKHHYGAQKVCHLCAAEKLPEPARYMCNFSLAAPHRDTLVGPLPQGPGKWESLLPRSPLCLLPGFSIWRCVFDLTHALELGLLQRVAPAALQGLMGGKVGGQPAQEPSAFRGSTSGWMAPGSAPAARSDASQRAGCRGPGQPSPSGAPRLQPCVLCSPVL